MNEKHAVPSRPNPGAGSPLVDQRLGPDPGNATPPPVESPSFAESDRVIASFWVLPVRVTWFAAGPMAMLLALAKIADSGGGWFTVLDAVYWGVVGLMVCCRWLDQRSGVATTAYGEPSTWADFRRYAAFLPPIALVAWLIANGLGNHILSAGTSG